MKIKFKRKIKGFTLIELLAVIVILSVIAVIAVPIVMNYIDRAFKSSLKNSAYSYIQAIEYYVARANGDDDPTNDKYFNGEFYDPNLEIRGTRPTDVDLIVSNGVVKSGFIVYDSYSIKIEEGKVTDFIKSEITLKLNGDSSVTIETGSDYNDLGATASDSNDGDISSAITVNSNLNINKIGTYTITYSVKNSISMTRTITRTVIVVDTTAPVITILGNNPTTHIGGTPYIDSGATAIDNYDGDITSNILVSSSVVPSIVGTYKVTYTVIDSSGNSTSAIRNVNVTDVDKPEVAFSLNGNSTYAKTYSTTITVTDNAELNTNSFKYLWKTNTTTPVEADFSNSFTNEDVIIVPEGVSGGYYLWVFAKDSAGNTEIIRSNVFNLDNTGPVITVSGTNPLTLEGGSTYTDSGATSTDAISGSRTVTTSGSVNPIVPGTYVITYESADALGNTSSKTRTVNVVDTTKPTIAFGTNGNSNYAKTYSTTVTVSDNISVNTSSLEYQWTTSATAPTEASFTTSFVNSATINTPASSTGSYYLWILAKDTIGNTNIIKSNVFNLDNSVPSVSFGTNGSASYVKSSSTTLTITDTGSAMSVLKYQWTTSATAPTEASFSTTFTSGSTISTPAGVSGGYYLWILAKDAASNLIITKTNVFNLDNTNPTLSITGANPYQITVGGTFTEPGVSATDNSGATPTVTKTTLPTAVGTYTITYTATDAAGNSATGTRSYYIWSAWSTYSTTAVSPSTTVEVQTKVQQRSSTRTTTWSTNSALTGTAALPGQAGTSSTAYTKTSSRSTDYGGWSCSVIQWDACSNLSAYNYSYGGYLGQAIAYNVGGGISGYWSQTRNTSLELWADYYHTRCGLTVRYKQSGPNGTYNIAYSEQRCTRPYSDKWQYYQWSAWTSWSDVSSCSSNTADINYGCQTLYSSRNR